MGKLNLDLIIFLVFVGIALVRGLKALSKHLNEQAREWQEKNRHPAGMGQAEADLWQSRPASERQSSPPAAQGHDGMVSPRVAKPDVVAARSASETATEDQGRADSAAYWSSGQESSEGAAYRSEMTDDIARDWSRRRPPPTPPGATPTPGGRATKHPIILDLKDRRKLRLAILTREVLDRPRAFDV